jgi:hypothetical protein
MYCRHCGCVLGPFASKTPPDAMGFVEHKDENACELAPELDPFRLVYEELTGPDMLVCGLWPRFLALKQWRKYHLPWRVRGEIDQLHLHIEYHTTDPRVCKLWIQSLLDPAQGRHLAACFDNPNNKVVHGTFWHRGMWVPSLGARVRIYPRARHTPSHILRRPITLVITTVNSALVNVQESVNRAMPPPLRFGFVKDCKNTASDGFQWACIPEPARVSPTLCGRRQLIEWGNSRIVESDCVPWDRDVWNSQTMLDTAFDRYTLTPVWWHKHVAPFKRVTYRFMRTLSQRLRDPLVSEWKGAPLDASSVFRLYSQWASCDVKASEHPKSRDLEYFMHIDPISDIIISVGCNIWRGDTSVCLRRKNHKSLRVITPVGSVVRHNPDAGMHETRTDVSRDSCQMFMGRTRAKAHAMLFESFCLEECSDVDNSEMKAFVAWLEVIRARVADVVLRYAKFHRTEPGFHSVVMTHGGSPARTLLDRTTRFLKGQILGPCKQIQDSRATRVELVSRFFDAEREYQTSGGMLGQQVFKMAHLSRPHITSARGMEGPGCLSDGQRVYATCTLQEYHGSTLSLELEPLSVCVIESV